MPETTTDPSEKAPHESVLTLEEAAAFLRADPDALADLASRGTLPAQQIGGERRFLKQALIEWLHLGPHFRDWMFRAPLPWRSDYPPFEDLVSAIEKRLLMKREVSREDSPKRGSKQAVDKYFGIFREDGDLEERLADLAAQRAAAPDGAELAALLQQLEREQLKNAPPPPPRPPLPPATIHYTELPEAPADHQGREDWELYRREVGRLLAEGHEGRWILIKDEEIVGIWDTREEADQIRRARFLMQPILLKQLLTNEPVVRGGYLCRWAGWASADRLVR